MLVMYKVFAAGNSDRDIMLPHTDTLLPHVFVALANSIFLFWLAVSGGPDIACFRKVAMALSGAGWEVVHLVSVGGWDQAHPDDITAGDNFLGCTRALLACILV